MLEKLSFIWKNVPPSFQVDACNFLSLKKSAIRSQMLNEKDLYKIEAIANKRADRVREVFF